MIDDESLISWSGDLKEHLTRGITVKFDPNKIRKSIYRPFTKSFLYFDQHLNNRRYQFPQILPTIETEKENQFIGITGLSSEKPFSVIISNVLIDLNMLSPGTGGVRCFPFYTYDKDGSNRQENITDWALKQYIIRLIGQIITVSLETMKIVKSLPILRHT